MKIKKALTFRASSIGDCLMGKYLLENIHQKFPDAHLGIVVGSRANMIRDLCAAYPWLEVIEANRRSPWALWSLWRGFRNSDLVVTQYAGKQGGKFSLWSKSVARVLARKGGLIGFIDSSKINGFLYDTLLPFSRTSAPVCAEREALCAIDVPIVFKWPTIQKKQIQSITEKFNLVSRNYVVVHLFAGNKGRGLRPDKKRQLLTILDKVFPETPLVVSGGASDREEALEIIKGLRAIVIAGETTLQELINLIDESRSVVSIDTGVAHIAAQLGKPLTVFSSCLGAHWWLTEQYGENAPIAVFSRNDMCVTGHLAKEYPDCINAIDMNTIVPHISAL